MHFFSLNPTFDIFQEEKWNFITAAVDYRNPYFVIFSEPLNHQSRIQLVWRRLVRHKNVCKFI